MILAGRKRKRRFRQKRRFCWVCAGLLFGVVAVGKLCFPETIAVWTGEACGVYKLQEAVAAFGGTVAGTEDAEAVWSALDTNTESDEEVVEVFSSGEVDLKTLFSAGKPEEPEQSVEEIQVLHDLDVAFNEEDLSDDTSDEEIPEQVDLNLYKVSFETTTPVYGPITSDFGWRDHPVDGKYKYHYGIDIAASGGTDILCFADGVVEEAGYSSVNGNYLKVRHQDGFYSMYAHCRELYVQEGETVSIGQTLAAVGMTGTATGNHLHFQIYHDGKIVDPKDYVTP